MTREELIKKVDALVKEADAAGLKLEASCILAASVALEDDEDGMCRFNEAVMPYMVKTLAGEVGPAAAGGLILGAILRKAVARASEGLVDTGQPKSGGVVEL